MSGSNFKGTVVLADTETTDKDIITAGVCQIAAAAMTQDKGMNWQISPLFQTYCSPSEPMKPEALAVHGITEEMYRYAPSDVMATSILHQIICNLPQPVILSGYNCTRYDYPLLEKLFREAQFTQYPHIDVMTLYMRTAPEGGLKLSEVFEAKVNDRDLLEGAHDAMHDVWMTGLLLNNFFNQYATDPVVLAEWCNTPTVLEVMPFGKYKGYEFTKIPRSYLEWMAAKWTDMHPDLAATLRQYGVK